MGKGQGLTEEERSILAILTTERYMNRQICSFEDAYSHLSTLTTQPPAFGIVVIKAHYSLSLIRQKQDEDNRLLMIQWIGGLVAWISGDIMDMSGHVLGSDPLLSLT